MHQKILGIAIERVVLISLDKVCEWLLTFLVEELVYSRLLGVEEECGHVVVGTVGAEETAHRGVDVLCPAQLGGESSRNKHCHRQMTAVPGPVTGFACFTQPVCM